MMDAVPRRVGEMALMLPLERFHQFGWLWCGMTNAAMTRILRGAPCVPCVRACVVCPLDYHDGRMDGSKAVDWNGDALLN